MTDYLVDTDISVFEIDMADASVSGDNMIFGISDSGVSTWIETYEGTGHYARIAGTGYARINNGLIDGIIRFDMPAGKVQIKGSDFAISTRGTMKYVYPFCIFARNRYGTSPGIENKHKGLKIRSFTIYENEEVVRNYVPCLDSLGRPCLLETVKCIPHYNAGTGEFLYGNVVEE